MSAETREQRVLWRGGDSGMTDDLRGISDYLFGKLSDEIGSDRIIPLEDGQIAYIDTEGCAVYLVTIQRAKFVPAAGEEGTE